MTIAKQINFEKLLSPIFKRQTNLMVFYKIAQGWGSFVDKAFVSLTIPLKLSNGILVVAVPNSSVSSQFYYSKEKVTANISLHLGYDAIVDIKTILKPLDNWKTPNFIETEDTNFADISRKEVDLQEKFARLVASIRES